MLFAKTPEKQPVPASKEKRSPAAGNSLFPCAPTLGEDSKTLITLGELSVDYEHDKVFSRKKILSPLFAEKPKFQEFMRNGFLVGGNWIIDLVKIIDAYPAEEKLVNILGSYRCNGGSAYNLVKALFKLGVQAPLEGIGRVGEDEKGDAIIDDCRSMGMDTRQLKKTPQAQTAFTDVMVAKSTGKRTFFHQRGANAWLDETDFDFSATHARIFHLGYLLLLDKLDTISPDGSTGASRVLQQASRQGLLTSVDLVSENSARFREIVPPSLPFVDFLFVNEFEAQMLTGISTAHADGSIALAQCVQAAAAILRMGVRQWVVLHFPAGVLAMGKNGEELFQPSIQLPPQKIVGALGVGDALAAGVLLGVHEQWPMKESLKLGVCAAAACLFKATSSDGILPAAECLQLATTYGFGQLQVKA